MLCGVITCVSYNEWIDDALAYGFLRKKKETKKPRNDILWSFILLLCSMKLSCREKQIIYGQKERDVVDDVLLAFIHQIKQWHEEI